MESGKKILWCYAVGRSPHAGGTGRRLVCLKCRGCAVSVVMMLGLGGHMGGLSSTLREGRKPLQCLKQKSEGIRGTVWKRAASSMEDELDKDKTAGGAIWEAAVQLDHRDMAVGKGGGIQNGLDH